MKTTKEQINKIKELKKQGKRMIEISRELKLPYSTVQYYSKDKYRKKQRERAKKNRYPQNEENYRKYQRDYHRKKYQENTEYREYIKEKNREYHRKKY